MSSTSPQRRSLPRFAEVAVERARLSVVPRLRSRAPRIPFVTLVSVILLAGVVGLLLFNTSMQQASFTASKLEDQADDLSARHELLASELESLRSPRHLAALGCQLEMVVPLTVAFLDKTTGAVTGTPSAATQAATCDSDVPPPPKDPLVRSTGGGDTPGGSTTVTTSTNNTTGTGALQAEPLRFGR